MWMELKNDAFLTIFLEDFFRKKVDQTEQTVDSDIKPSKEENVTATADRNVSEKGPTTSSSSQTAQTLQKLMSRFTCYLITICIV